MSRLLPRALAGALLGLVMLVPPAAAGSSFVRVDTPSDSSALYQILPLMSEPPALGDVLLDDPLTGTLLVEGSVCPTGRNRREFVGEGFIIKVTGRCFEADDFAGAIREVSGLTFADGSLRLELRAVSGPERAQLRLMFRDQGSDPRNYYVVRVTPQTGAVVLLKNDAATGGREVALSAGELPNAISLTDWNALELRARGDEIWVLLNDQLVLAATDQGWPQGRVLFGVDRLGNLDDTAESAVVFRNLRVAQLAAPNEGRSSVFQPVARTGRRPGAKRVLPADMTDLQACWDLGVADAEADRAAGVWRPQFPEGSDTRESRNCGLAYAKGYLGCPFVGGPCPPPRRSNTAPLRTDLGDAAGSLGAALRGTTDL